MNFKKLRSIIVVALIIFIGVLAFKLVSSNTNSSAALINVSTLNPVDFSEDSQNSNANYIYAASGAYYDNYEMADERTNLLFIGEIIKVNAPEELLVSRTFYPNTGETLEGKSIYTISDVRVDKVIKGNIKKGDIIQVKQQGGIVNNVPLLAKGVKFFKEKERRIFFLETYEGFDFKTYPSPINPEQGSVLIEKGKTKRANSMQFINDEIDEDKLVDALTEKIKELHKN